MTKYIPFYTHCVLVATLHILRLVLLLRISSLYFVFLARHDFHTVCPLSIWQHPCYTSLKNVDKVTKQKWKWHAKFLLVSNEKRKLIAKEKIVRKNVRLQFRFSLFACECVTCLNFLPKHKMPHVLAHVIRFVKRTFFYVSKFSTNYNLKLTILTFQFWTMLDAIAFCAIFSLFFARLFIGIAPLWIKVQFNTNFTLSKRMRDNNTRTEVIKQNPI